MVHEFTYLGSTITDNLSLYNKRIGKTGTTPGRLTTRVCENPKLRINTKMAVSNAYIVALFCTGVLLGQHIASKSGSSIVSTCEASAGSSATSSPHGGSGPHWSPHYVTRYSGSADCAGSITCAALRMAGSQKTSSMESLPLAHYTVAAHSWGLTCLQTRHESLRHWSWEMGRHRNSWRSLLHKQLKKGEDKITRAAAEKGPSARRRDNNPVASTNICSTCGRDCHSRIGFTSHRRRCPELRTTNWWGTVFPWSTPTERPITMMLTGAFRFYLCKCMDLLKNIIDPSWIFLV